MGYFIAWMVLFPISQELCSLLSDSEKNYSDGVLAASSFVMIVIWLGVGFKIFQWAVER
ncbi:TMhelix containing protein [Vibrio phage 1.256.O._10N.286.45.F8]|nr:TMhelix containing protein [Vibrio phage 1.256.O._10N.286.45.F8]